MFTGRRSQAEPEFTPGWPDPPAYDALTDLNAYALRFDFEVHRLGERLVELAALESSVAERRAVMRERVEMVEELQAFRRAIAAFQEVALQRPNRSVMNAG